MYTVTAQQQIPLPVHQVWDYLTKPELLAQWFGDTPEFGPGDRVRMDFGDGDFLSGRVVEWDPGIVLGLHWRFIGHGPEYRVLYSLLRRKDGTELTVQDRGSITQEEAECMRVGWSEFLFRLNKAIVKNVTTRFSWRKAFLFTITVAQREAFVKALTDPDWYHASLAGVGARIRNSDEHEINSIITHEAWGDVETRLRVRLKNIRGNDYAIFAHEGWPELPMDIAEAERRRFVSVWLNAMEEFAARRDEEQDAAYQLQLA